MITSNRRYPLRKSEARNIVRQAGRLGLSPTYHHTLSTGYYVVVDGRRFDSMEDWTKGRARLAHTRALAASTRRTA